MKAVAPFMNKPGSRKQKAATRKGYRTLAHSSLLAAFCLLTFCSTVLGQGALSPDPLPKNAEPKIVQPAEAPKDSLPVPLRKVGIDQRLNNQVPLELVFTDE